MLSRGRSPAVLRNAATSSAWPVIQSRRRALAAPAQIICARAASEQPAAASSSAAVQIRRCAGNSTSSISNRDNDVVDVSAGANDSNSKNLSSKTFFTTNTTASSSSSSSSSRASASAGAGRHGKAFSSFTTNSHTKENFFRRNRNAFEGQRRTFFQNFAGAGGFGGGFPGGNSGGSNGGGNQNQNQNPRPTSKKLYDILDLKAPGTPGAPEAYTEKQLKQAYKKKAKEHHPDLGGDADKFKDVSKAFDILSDPAKKQMYDRYGDEGVAQHEQQQAQGGGGGGAGGAGPHFHDPFEMFRQHFEGSAFGGQRASSQPLQKTPDAVHTVKMTLEEAFSGVTKEFRVPRVVACTDCGGEGSLNVETCPDCGGGGVVIEHVQAGPFVQAIQRPCGRCGARGKVSRGPEKRCGTCGGKGKVRKNETFVVEFVPGVTSGELKSFAGKADEMCARELKGDLQGKPGLPAGDLVFVSEVQRHKVFTRVGQDLVMSKKLPLQDALCGFRFGVKFLDGEELVIESGNSSSSSGGNSSGSSSSHDPVNPGDVWRVVGKGMPGGASSSSGGRSKFPSRQGDLLVRFEVVFPERGELGLDARAKLTELGLRKSAWEPAAKKSSAGFLEAKSSAGGGGGSGSSDGSSDGRSNEGGNNSCSSPSKEEEAGSSKKDPRSSRSSRAQRMTAAQRQQLVERLSQQEQRDREREAQAKRGRRGGSGGGDGGRQEVQCAQM